MSMDVFGWSNFDQVFHLSVWISTTLSRISLEMLEGDRESSILRG